jgi:flagellar biosynthetic protein FlhB
MLAAVAIGDYFFQYRQWYERQKMSLQEIKDEFKQSEGDPHIKGKIRQLRQQRMKKRMMAAVPKASVIITNPTHYSVALSYDRGMSAPVCVAKGVDSIAFKIREIAKKHDIPIIENVPLARALYATVDIDDEIPVEHYHAVAEIIGYVMGLKRGVSGRRTDEKTRNRLEMRLTCKKDRLMDLRLPVRFRHSGEARKSARRLHADGPRPLI